MNSTATNTSAPSPADQLVDENGSTNCWLVSAWTEAQIRDEWDWLFENGENLHEVYYRFRWVTPKELEDEYFLYDQFGDHELSGVGTDVVCIRCKADAVGAWLYWTTEP
jgi:hypothetical protein